MASFLDTNVLVYAYDRASETKREIALEILEDDTLSLVISSQVLNEFYWVTTRKLRPPLSADVAHEVVRQLSEGEVVAVDAALVDDAITLSKHHRISLWDAGIIAAARRADCTELLTEDLAHGSVVGGVKVRDPFV